MKIKKGIGIVMAVAGVLCACGCSKTCGCYRYSGTLDEYSREELNEMNVGCNALRDYKNLELNTQFYSYCTWE